MEIMYCELCGSEVTVPYFYKGKIYGWSCIKKVNPSQKKILYKTFDTFLVKRNVVGSDSKRCVVIYKGIHVEVTGEIIKNILFVSEKQLIKLIGARS